MTVTAAFANLDRLLDGIDRTGVLHVGAHRGQEVGAYRAAGFDRIALVEPNPQHWPALERISGTVLFRCAAGPAGTATLNVTKGTELSSILPPVKYRVERTETVDVRPVSELQDGCNVAVFDIQGYELEALRTADLDRLDVVVVECSDRQRYEGAPVTADVSAFMTDAGWSLVEMCPHRGPGVYDAVWRKGDR